jgi:hypothetical protein
MKTLPTLVIASSLALGACATPAPGTGGDTPPASAACNADAAQSAVGKTATPDVVEQARTDAGADMARVLKPGQVVTMEYREGRLNVHVDANNVIESVRCG